MFTLIFLVLSLVYRAHSENSVYFNHTICSHTWAPWANIFGADSLLNSTVRLYSHHHYYDLVLFNRTEYSALRSFTRTSSGEVFYGLLKGPIQSRFNMSIVDSPTYGMRTIASVSDAMNNELTMLFSTSQQSPGHQWTFHTHNSTLISEGELNFFLDSSTNSSGNISLEITATFRAFISNVQYRFFIVNNKDLLYTEVKIDNFQDSNKIGEVHVDDGRFFSGTVPQTITAAVVIQITSCENILVLFRCSQFCSIPFNDNKWNLSECHAQTDWQDVTQFFQLEEPTGERVVPFSDFHNQDSFNEQLLIFLSESIDASWKAIHFTKDKIATLTRTRIFLVVIITMLLIVSLLTYRYSRKKKNSKNVENV